MNKIPALYETEPIRCEDKIIYQHYHCPNHHGFYWLIAELDEQKKLAFGYACLNDPQLAEWGYIDINELEDVGAVLNKDWKPVPFREAIKIVQGDYS